MSLLVQRENSYANVVRLNVAAVQPEVFQYGMQQGIAVDLMGNLIGPSNPAHAGEALVVYCAGWAP
jgi:uncharacterized protein (TIGR03437 family)